MQNCPPGSYPISADGTPQPYPPAGAQGWSAPGQPIIFFDSYANAGPTISQDVQRRAAHLIVEAFPTQPGTATIQIVDANAQAGSLTNCTDSNGSRASISAYTKFMIKGLMERVAVKLTVASGAWSVWGTFTDQASDRANYFDRNPLIATQFYNQAIAPAASTQRWAYTVPGGRKAYLESLFLQIRRTALATNTPPSWVNVSSSYIPSGASGLVIARIAIATNVLNAMEQATMNNFGLLLAGDQVTLATEDLGTGGTISFIGSMKASEFDA